jgi:hypothetical protein
MQCSCAGNHRTFKWYYLLAIVFGLAAIAAVVFLILRSGCLVKLLSDNTEETELIEDDLE